MNQENSITKEKNLLFILGQAQASKELEELLESFCGQVLQDKAQLPAPNPTQKLYLAGDMSHLSPELSHGHIIQELSYNIPKKLDNPLVGLGQVPIIVHQMGVYFRKLFSEDNYFEQIVQEHEFQELTESTKQSKALRKGIYLSAVTQEITSEQKELLHYNLMRCSSNLTGPTDNFRATDHHILAKLNEAAAYTFEQAPSLNHVLAQIYYNKKEGESPQRMKEKKAKISAHSDKTKDMLEEGLIAFCTFYDKANFDQLQPSQEDRFDYGYKKHSGLTKLHFKLKKTVEDDNLVKEFYVTLYPNSVFMIPLSTNRFYTHAISPSPLNVDRIPVRMGYVVRSSKQKAVYMDNQVFIQEKGEWLPLQPMSQEMLSELRTSYYEENATEKKVQYKEVHFSMNQGDYQKPIY